METPADLEYHRLGGGYGAAFPCVAVDMPAKIPAEARTPGERPRVRPSLWLVILILGGLGLMLLGHEQEWFLGPLESGKLHNLTFLLAWAMAGTVYSILAICFWVRFASRATGRKVLVSFLVVFTIMLTGSQIAARAEMRYLGVVITRIEWNSWSEEFVITAVSSPRIVESQRKGDLRVLVSIEGTWWDMERGTWNWRQAKETEVFVGSPQLLGYRRGVSLPIAPEHRPRAALAPLRLPWSPALKDAHRVCYIWVDAALADPQGRRIGRESAVWFEWGRHPRRRDDWLRFDPGEERDTTYLRKIERMREIVGHRLR